MKQLTFDHSEDGLRMFKLALLGVYNKEYRFQSEDEIRHHSKLLDAIEAISHQDENSEGLRVLDDGDQILVMDDAWLTLWIRMASPPHMFWPANGAYGTTTRFAVKMIDFLKAAKVYTVPKKEPPASKE